MFKRQIRERAYCLLVATLLATPCFAQERGSTLFSDSFDTYATFAENWVPEGRNIKPENGHLLFDKGGAMWMKRDTPLEFCAEMDVTMDMSHKPDKNTWGAANCGFRIEDYSFFVLTHGNSWVIYKLPGWKKSQGIQIGIDGFELGKPFNLMLIRKVDKGNATYVFRGNGKDIGRFICEAPKPDAKGLYKPLIFISNDVTMTMDNFILSTVKDSSDASPNVVINSSFEHEQEGFPLYYCRMPTFKFSDVKPVPYESYIANWQLDTTEKHSGKYSLKMEMNDSMSYQELFAHSAGWVKDKPGVFSVWLKADKNNFPVNIGYGVGKEVLVGTEWKRYEVVNPKMSGTGPYSPVRIQFSKVNGTLWVDDLQAEFLDELDESKLKAGETFATPYKVSALDKQKFGRQDVEKPVRAPEFTIPKLPDGTTVNGDLDAWKDKAVKLDKFYFDGKTPANKTGAYLACDDKNLYLGYRCFVNELPKVNPKQGSRDGFDIFAHDSVECLLDPTADGKYYQFATDAAGSQTDVSLVNSSAWNGDWRSEAKLNEKEKSVDYVITVPLANFTDANMKPRWQVNICRNDISTGWQQVSIARKGFKNTEYWAYANLPEDVVKKYAFGVTEGSYSDTKAGTAVSLKVSNNTGEDLKLNAELSDLQNNSGVIGTREITLKKGVNDLSFTSKAKTNKVILKFKDGDKNLASQIVQLESRSPVSMLSRLSYYMTEPEASFKVETNLPEPEKLTAVLTLGKSEVKHPAAAKFNMTLPLKDVPDGTYDVTLALLKDGRKVAETGSKLIKRTYKAGATQVNHFSRSLLHDGKPIVPFMPFFESGPHSGEFVRGFIDHLVNNGFKYVHYLPYHERWTSVEPFLQYAKEKNLKLMIWTKVNENDEVYKKIESHQNIISQMVMDEPEIQGITSADAKAYLDKMRAKFPYHPTHMNNTCLGIPNRYADLNTDILGLDFYLTSVEKQLVSNVIAQADIMWKMGKEECKPCMFFLVGGNFPLHYREPSYAEQIAQTYGTLCAGCTAFSYFYGVVQTGGNWKAMKQLNREILSLTDVICSEEETAQSACSANPTTLRNITKKFDGYIYVISCNIDENPMGEVSFTLPPDLQYDGGVEVLFEDRALTLNGGKFSDEFAGYLRHVYRVKIK